jgi:hypothetical protein
MKRRAFLGTATGSALLLSTTDMLGTMSAFAEGGNAEYQAVGTFAEGCTCSIACPCAFSGKFGDHCHGASALILSSGMYGGKDLATSRVVWAGHAGQWSYLYVGAPPPNREAATAFAKTIFGPMGKIEAVKNASVELTGKGGQYRLTIDGGKILELTMEPVLGLDKKTAISHGNTVIPWSPMVMQGRTIKASFHDGDRSFTFEGSNAFFNEAMKSNGTLSD